MGNQIAGPVGAAILPLLAGGRIGLNSAYVSTSDLTAQLVLNWNPGGPNGNRLVIYNGAAWFAYASSQLSIKATDSAQTGGTITSTTITGLTSTAQLVPGMTLTASTGTGTLAANTVISTIVSATSITVNNAASVNGTLTNLVFKLVASNVYDVILVNDAGTLRMLFSPAWTNDTTPVASLTTQNGITVNSGSWTTGWTNGAATVPTLTGLFMGRIRTTASAGQMEDSVLNRYVASALNPVQRELFTCPGYVNDNATTTWTTTSTTFAEANGGTGSKVSFVTINNNGPYHLFLSVTMNNSGANSTIAGIGIDSASSASVDCFLNSTSALAATCNIGGGKVPVVDGAHFGDFLAAVSGGTGTYYADTSRLGSSADPFVSTLSGWIWG